MWARSSLSLLGLLAAVGVAACDVHPTGVAAPEDARFVASVSGTTTQGYDGRGFFYAFVPPAGLPRPAHFTLFSTEVDRPNQRAQQFELKLWNATRPAEGRHPIQPLVNPFGGGEPTFHARYSQLSGATNDLYVARSGEVEITHSSADRVEGTFHFTGARVCRMTPEEPGCRWPRFPGEPAIDLDTLPAIDVTGSFVARPGRPIMGVFR
jgi:hypothetical protein